MSDVFSVLAGVMSAIDGRAANLDERFGVLASGVAGAVAALAVAVIMAIYYRSGYRSRRGALRHGAAAVIVVGLLAFVAPDMRHAALDYLGLNPSKPAVEFEIHLPKTTASALAKEIEIVLGADENPRGCRGWTNGCSPPATLRAQVASTSRADATHSVPNTIFAIRHRVT
jgi:hypothetical protein